MPDIVPWTTPQRVLLALSAVILVLLAWRLADVVILLFGAVVLAVALRALAGALERRLRLPRRVSVPAAVLLVAGVLAAVGWTVGDALEQQVDALRERLPQAWQAVQAWLKRYALGRHALEALATALDGGIPGPQVAKWAGVTLGALGSVVLLVIAGIYMAADPGLYRRGLVRLFPTAQRLRIDAALAASGHALSRWLLGQAVSMVFLGSTTALGLWLLGVPLALVLGLITGLAAFVPFFGAIAAGTLSVLLAFVEGPTAALHVALMYLAIQQVEEYLLLPLVQRWAVKLPPVLSLIAALVFGHLFGVLGVVFATPLIVVVIVLVRRLYVEEMLERRRVSLPPAPAPAGATELPARRTVRR